MALIEQVGLLVDTILSRAVSMSRTIESDLIGLVEMIRLGETFLLPDHPSTFTEVRLYRRISCQGLIEVYGDDSEPLRRFQLHFSRAFDPGAMLTALMADGANIIDLDAGPDALEACNKVAVEETLDILREAVRYASRAASKQPLEDGAVDHRVPEMSESKPTRRKHGPAPDEHSWTVAEIVGKHLPDWKTSDSLDDICEKLDTLKIPIPPKWAEWKPRKPNSWVRAAEYGRGKVVKVIEQRLKMANTHPPPASWKPSEL